MTRRPVHLFWGGLLWVLLGMGGNCARAADASDQVHSFQIGAYTEIKLDGEEVPIAQLKVGMQAFVTPDSFQEGYAAMIDAHIPLRRESAAAAAPASPASATSSAPSGAKASAPIPAPARQWTITAVTPGAITVTFK